MQSYLGILLASSLFSVIACHSHMCNHTQLRTQVVECEKSFFKAMVDNKQADCKSEYDKIVSCVGSLAKNCHPHLPVAVVDNLVSLVFNQMKGHEFYCEKNVMTFHWQNIPKALKDNMPCKMEFYNKSAECAQDFREIFNGDPRNYGICSAFDGARLCIGNHEKAHCSAALGGPKYPYPHKCPPSSATAPTQLGIHALLVLFIVTWLL
ncbi:predicted protein [Nematostella vectensis]|uniref:Uncharacterized protein n=1 Tax=Nematostella vectensis TaxID=45351 RepID=A7SB97_NEMVE|nr:uncharacterized protein LOC5510662 [Nematostella vectensis]EDO39074.1 predicted protein [Nematostella vectensis]|eukprot:XP_001631137.1 predicted protein [Nematostella vectensis]